MKKLMISSTESFSGKSGITLSLALILKERGYDVGYFKAFGINAVRIGDRICDEDALLAEKVLGLENTCAIVLDRPYVDFLISEDPSKLKKRILESFERQLDKEVVLIEGSHTYLIGASLGICDVHLSKLLDSKVLMVSKFSSDFVIDEILFAKRFFEERLQKIILNQVVGYKRSYISLVSENVFKKNGIELIGAIPRDIALVGLKVSEIANLLGGIYLLKPEKDETVEQILVGAMKAETALSYLRSARNYALITGGDRGDLIALAIESGAKCVIATGNLEPPSQILSLAEQHGVAILLSREDTATTLSRIQEKFGRIRMNEEKLKRMKKLVEENVCVEELVSYLGL
ncbi:MAG: phosphotransacetylase family protein [Archaeoglobaceae archaeon]|nr:phosphotransacetylase family protein [Archaeoglobaceae archaeon]MDW8127761.1 phosphotransacetylase family protein [Archaeoglobaceae archaeon]